GISGDKVDYLLELRASNQDIVKPYTYEYPNAQFFEGKRPWEVKCDVALPCAIQNELNLQDAQNLVNNGVLCVSEGANMPCTPEAMELFLESKILYGPGKASNAGGVATSGLEQTQNAMKLNWPAEEVEAKLHNIMKSIHEACVKYGQEEDGFVNYVKGSNIAGFIKVADSMIDQGVI
ncbi:MAG: glutamate dehydrogenase, partial [Bacteroidales bacterium]